ncbi:TPA: hypothetical protein HA265_01335 [Candidatus Woesearchaeota archaeon]|nr:hypothetical protein [Candidatus Woesearchaeota archaeon]
MNKINNILVALLLATSVASCKEKKETSSMGVAAKFPKKPKSPCVAEAVLPVYEIVVQKGESILMYLHGDVGNFALPSDAFDEQCALRDYSSKGWGDAVEERTMAIKEAISTIDALVFLNNVRSPEQIKGYPSTTEAGLRYLNRKLFHPGNIVRIPKFLDPTYGHNSQIGKLERNGSYVGNLHVSFVPFKSKKEFYEAEPKGYFRSKTRSRNMSFRFRKK